MTNTQVKAWVVLDLTSFKLATEASELYTQKEDAIDSWGKLPLRLRKIYKVTEITLCL